jgi:hypothetical protein
MRPARLPSLGMAVLVTLLAIGCASRTVVVTVPPRIDLAPYRTIGLVEFSSDPARPLDQTATERFMAVVQASQPNVRFLELGPAHELLKALGRDRFDPETARLLGRQQLVETVFTGTYDVSDVKPKVSLGPDFSSISASARVRMSLSVKQWDTKTGATVWTNAREGEWPVAHVRKAAGQPVSFSASKPEDRYAEFLGELVDAVTEDFQVHYERRKAAK